MKIFLNCSYLLALNSIERDGKAAWAIEAAKRAAGTYCKTWAKLKATIEPTVAIEAKAMLIMSEILVKPRAIERGHIRERVSRTSLFLISKFNLNLKPKESA